MFFPRLSHSLPQGSFVDHRKVCSNQIGDGTTMGRFPGNPPTPKRQVGAICVKAPRETLPWAGTAPLDCL